MLVPLTFYNDCMFGIHFPKPFVTMTYFSTFSDDLIVQYGLVCASQRDPKEILAFFSRSVGCGSQCEYVANGFGTNQNPLWTSPGSILCSQHLGHLPEAAVILGVVSINAPNVGWVLPNRD